ncbi:hypothetical protein FUSPEROL_02176, partial [Fusobacterium periodonticum ATCC 33693]
KLFTHYCIHLKINKHKRGVSMNLFRYQYIVRIQYKYKKKYRFETLEITSYKKLNKENISMKIKRKNFKIIYIYLSKKEFIFMDFYRNFKKEILQIANLQLNYFQYKERK